MEDAEAPGKLARGLRVEAKRFVLEKGARYAGAHKEHIEFDDGGL